MGVVAKLSTTLVIGAVALACGCSRSTQERPLPPNNTELSPETDVVADDASHTSRQASQSQESPNSGVRPLKASDTDTVEDATPVSNETEPVSTGRPENAHSNNAESKTVASQARGSPGPGELNDRNRRGRSAEQALRQAKTSWAKAQRVASQGKRSEPFTHALEAWQTLQPHLANGNCRELSDAIAPKLKDYGEATNSAHGTGIASPSNPKPIVVQ